MLMDSFEFNPKYERPYFLEERKDYICVPSLTKSSNNRHLKKQNTTQHNTPHHTKPHILRYYEIIKKKYHQLTFFLIS